MIFFFTVVGDNSGLLQFGSDIIGHREKCVWRVLNAEGLSRSLQLFVDISNRFSKHLVQALLAGYTRY